MNQKAFLFCVLIISISFSGCKIEKEITGMVYYNKMVTSIRTVDTCDNVFTFFPQCIQKSGPIRLSGSPRGASLIYSRNVCDTTIKPVFENNKSYRLKGHFGDSKEILGSQSTFFVTAYKQID